MLLNEVGAHPAALFHDEIFDEVAVFFREPLGVEEPLNVPPNSPHVLHCGAEVPTAALDKTSKLSWRWEQRGVNMRRDEGKQN